MNASNNQKIAAIIPALNEEAYVANVLKVILDSGYFREIILVDDGSTDKTWKIGRDLGVKVVRLKKIGGKSNAVRQGLKKTKADIIALFDADLIGLTKSHISTLLESVISGKYDMCVGIRGRMYGLPKLIASIDSHLAIGGERVLKRGIIETLPESLTKEYALESALNCFCKKNNFSVKQVMLKNLDHVSKEKKWGWRKGFIKRIKMTGQIIKTRIKFLFISIRKLR